MLHKREIMKLIGLTDKQGYTLVPVDMHFSGSHVKVTVALCRGKKLYDKRDSAAAAQANRDMERHMSRTQSQITTIDFSHIYGGSKGFDGVLNYR